MKKLLLMLTIAVLATASFPQDTTFVINYKLPVTDPENKVIKLYQEGIERIERDVAEYLISYDAGNDTIVIEIETMGIETAQINTGLNNRLTLWKSQFLIPDTITVYGIDGKWYFANDSISLEDQQITLTQKRNRLRTAHGIAILRTERRYKKLVTELKQLNDYLSQLE
jgi:hypothetical protein